MSEIANFVFHFELPSETILNLRWEIIFSIENKAIKIIFPEARWNVFQIVGHGDKLFKILLNFY